MSIDRKWCNAPQNFDQAREAVRHTRCPVCDSPLLLPLVRPPSDQWKVHCNHCASEMLVAVLINRDAWGWV